jgi:hypothetical protein
MRERPEPKTVLCRMAGRRKLKPFCLGWIRIKNLSEQYARATSSDMIDKIADDIMTIADEDLIPTGEGKVDSAMVQKQRLTG